MTRDEVVTMAAIMSLHSSENETQRRANVEAAVASGRMLADALSQEAAPGIDPEAFQGAVTRAVGAALQERDELRVQLGDARQRIAELEKELEQATAPPVVEDRPGNLETRRGAGRRP